MADLATRMKRAREQVHVPWTDAQSRALERALPILRRRRRLRRAGLSTLALLLLAFGVRGRLRHEQPPAQAVVVVDRTLRFVDGSIAQPLTDDAIVRLETRTATRSVTKLVRGGARFAVVHDPSRVFRVEADDVAVEVLGTRFIVERVAERVRVSVESGRVRVLWGAEHAELAAGESDMYPHAVVAMIPRAPKPTPPLVEPAPTEDRRSQRWNALAQDGQFDQAYDELKRRGAPPVRDEPAELLAAADVARLSHHPIDALEPLERMLHAHASDARAPLAAFTLGRILLEDLGRPREAANAFVKAQALASDGVLVPDALAREVEAWSRAGDADQAHARAAEYLRRFPTGSRVRSVRRYGGLD
jgi:transmembrane sensor